MHGGGGVVGDAGAPGDLQLGDRAGAGGAAVAGVEEAVGAAGGVVGAGGEPAVDVGDDVGALETEDADLAAGADLDDGGVAGRGGAGLVVEGGGGGSWFAAGVGGEVAVLAGVDGGEVDHGGGGVVGDAGAPGDLQLGDRAGVDGVDHRRVAQPEGRGSGHDRNGQEDGDGSRAAPRHRVGQRPTPTGSRLIHDD